MIVTVLLDGDAVAGASCFCLPDVQCDYALRAYDQGTTSPMGLRYRHEPVLFMKLLPLSVRTVA